MSAYNDCGVTNSTMAIIDQLHFLSYGLVNQIYLVLGLFGNTVLLVAFYVQSKTEKAYGYQVILVISKILEILSFSIFLTTLKCFSGAENQEADWFVQDYTIMWLTGRVGPVAAIALIINSLLLTLAMTVDRFIALAKPFVYKDMNLLRQQVISVCLCLAVSILCSVSDAWRYDIGGEPGHYKLITNEEYVKSDVAIVTAHIRTGIRFAGVAGMIVLNIVVALMFRRQTRKVGQMTAENDDKQKSRRSAEKTLLVLSIYQSILMAISQTPHMGYHVLAYVVPSFTRCAGMVYSPTADAMIMVTDSIDLFVLMGINKKMRKAVMNGIACLFCCKRGAQETTATRSDSRRT